VSGQALTQRRTVRDADVADANVDAVDEVIDTRFDDNAQPAAHGYDATLAIFVVLDTAATVSIELWYRGNDEEDDGESSSSSPSGAAGDWCRYVVVAGMAVNTMLVYPNVPAGEWKVVVTATDGRVIIREAHST
jgi:hypothetical protein